MVFDKSDYREETCKCDSCKHPIEDGGEIVCYSCYDDVIRERDDYREKMNEAIERIEELQAQIDTLEYDISILNENKRY